MSASLDDNGVRHLYTPISGGESWIAKQGTNWTSDPRVLTGGHVHNITTNSDGTYGTDGNDEARISIATSSGYDSSKIVKDFSKLDIDKGGRGYMQDPNDWKNTEWGFYFNVSNWSTADQITMYLRGGRHYNPPTVSCEGFSYKIDIGFSDGKTRFAKESWHVHYDFTSWKDTLGLGSLRNKWIGMKVVVFNVKIGDATAVNCELWIDPDGLDSNLKPANNWQKADTFQDAGGFGSGGDQCGGDKTQIGNWGGPLAAFRWDNISSGGIKFVYLHAFEIDPTGTGGTGGGGTGPPAPPPFTPSCPNSPEDPIPSTQVAIISKHRFNLGDFDNPDHCQLPGEGIPDTGGGGGGGGGGGNLDQFGVEMKYPSLDSTHLWFMDMTNAVSGDSRVSSAPSMTHNSDGSWKITSTSYRMEVVGPGHNAAARDSTYATDIATTNQATLASNGHMLDTDDWRNVEITYYIKINSFTSSTTNGAAHTELLARGARHSTSDGFSGCSGTALHGNIYAADGRIKFEKELQHTAGYTTNDPQTTSATTSPHNRWIGVKLVIYNKANGNVILEYWIDDNLDSSGTVKNNWVLALTREDGNPSWGGGTPNCGGSDHTIISWGGPIAHFRADNISDMDFKFASVREIVPPA